MAYKSYNAVHQRDQDACRAPCSTPVTDCLGVGQHQVTCTRITHTSAGRWLVTLTDRYGCWHQELFDCSREDLPDEGNQLTVRLGWSDGFLIDKSAGSTFYVVDATSGDRYDEGPWSSYSEAYEAAVAAGLEEARVVLEEVLA